MRLSPRLQMVADMVRRGVAVADIGTDHAYLPVYLILQKVCPRALACDLRQEPLRNAAQSIQQYHLQAHIALRQSDGFDALAPSDAEDFILAGMGGTLMQRILARTAWLLDNTKRLILQPMTRAEEVRTWLTENRFSILQENACTDDGRLYIALCAEYTGEQKTYPPSYPYCGALTRCPAPEARQYIQRQYRRLKKRADALQQAALLPEEVAQLHVILQELEALLHSGGAG